MEDNQNHETQYEQANEASQGETDQGALAPEPESLDGSNEGTTPDAPEGCL